MPRFTEEDDALLEELGVEVETQKQASRTPREERIIDLPAAGRTHVVLHVTSAAGARPVDRDPRSTDRRLLGCWIEIR